MKKQFLLFIFMGLAILVTAQKEPAKVTVIRPVTTTMKPIPSVKATVIRKDVVKLKGQLVQLSDSITVTKREIDLLTDKMKNELNSMSEMGEEESLRLQMAMDRMTRMMGTLSNLLKKMSDTAQSITQNIK